MLWSIFYFHRTIYKSAEIFYSYHKVCAFDARSPWTWERSNVSRLNSFLKSYLWYLIFIKTFTIASARKHCLFSTFFLCFFFILLNNIIAPLPQSIHTRKVKTILTRVTVKAVPRNSRKLWKKKTHEAYGTNCGVYHQRAFALEFNTHRNLLGWYSDWKWCILTLSVIPTSRDCDIPQFIPKRISK